MSMGSKVAVRVTGALALSVGLVGSATPLPAQAASDSWGNGYLRLSSTCTGLGFGSPRINKKLNSGVYLKVYYGSRDGGTNCANLINTSGTKQKLDVYISFPSADGGGAWDRGSYSSYAGSVLLRGTKNSCIDVVGSVNGKEFNYVNVLCG